MKDIILVLLIIIYSSSLSAQDNNTNLMPFKSKKMYQIESNRPELLMIDTASASVEITYKYCNCTTNKKRIPEHNHIYLIDGLSIIDSTDTFVLQKLNPNSSSKIDVKIDIKTDTVYDSFKRIRVFDLIILTMTDSIFNTIKYINKQSGEWTLLHPLTSYQLNNKFITDTEKLSLFSSMKVDSIISVNTIINKEFPDGLITISTK